VPGRSPLCNRRRLAEVDHVTDCNAGVLAAALATVPVEKVELWYSIRLGDAVARVGGRDAMGRPHGSVRTMQTRQVVWPHTAEGFWWRWHHPAHCRSALERDDSAHQPRNSRGEDARRCNGCTAACA
jgi:hypothetical protein